MMYDIMRKIGTNVTIGSNVEFKNKVVFGDSILVYRKKRDGKTRKIIKEEVLPEEEPEIFEFLENNNFNFIRVELANDLVIFYDAYLEYILSNDPKSPKLVQIKAKEATCSRISEIDEKTGKSEWHGYSAEWKKGTPEDLVATPLLDRQTPLLDLKKRMGLAPDDEGNLVPINRPPANWKRLYSGSTSLHFIAKYRATGRRVTGGIANAQAWFSLTYQ